MSYFNPKKDQMPNDGYPLWRWLLIGGLVIILLYGLCQ